MKILFVAIIILSRFVTSILRLTGKGRGTALPGLIVERYFSFLIPYIFQLLPKTILITGTNGKTTTRTILTKILEDSGQKVIQNKSGSNLIRGLISEILSEVSLMGNLDKDIAVFEVEEATMPKLCLLINSEQIIVTNLYRDQLDAYGEIDRTEKFIQEAIDLSKQATVILNGDDPRVSKLTTKAKKIFFGIDDAYIKLFRYEGTQSTKAEIDIQATNIKIHSNLSNSFEIEKESYQLNLPGVFQIYNALAAVTSAKELGYDKDLNKVIEKVKPAFGRGEIIEYNDSTLQFLLIKNPAGLNLTLRLLNEIDKELKLIIILNDQTADGKDVSWIWDAEMEMLKDMNITEIICSGSRANDMLLRIKYSLGELKTHSLNHYSTLDNKTQIKLVKMEDFPKILNRGNYYVLPTYTAMLQLRKLLTGNALNV